MSTTEQDLDAWIHKASVEYIEVLRGVDWGLTSSADYSFKRTVRFDSRYHYRVPYGSAASLRGILEEVHLRYGAVNLVHSKTQEGIVWISCLTDDLKGTEVVKLWTKVPTAESRRKITAAHDHRRYLEPEDYTKWALKQADTDTPVDVEPDWLEPYQQHPTTSQMQELTEERGLLKKDTELKEGKGAKEMGGQKEATADGFEEKITSMIDRIQMLVQDLKDLRSEYEAAKQKGSGDGND